MGAATAGRTRRARAILVIVLTILLLMVLLFALDHRAQPPSDRFSWAVTDVGGAPPG